MRRRRVRCRKCGFDIGGTGREFTIYEGKEWCECSFIKDLIKETKRYNRKATLNELIDWLNEGCPYVNETLSSFGVKLAKKINEMKEK